MRIFIVKLILFLTRPEVAPSPRKRNLPFKTTVYLSVLKHLVSYYSRYSYEDTVHIGKNMTLKRSFRDPDFEKELQRMNVSLKPHMSASKAIKTKPSKRDKSISDKPYFKFFDFVDITSVIGFGKEVNIDRTKELDVYGSFPSKVRTSSEKDPVSVCAVEIALPKKQSSSSPSVSLLASENRTVKSTGSTAAEKRTVQSDKNSANEGQTIDNPTPQVKVPNNSDGLFAKETIPSSVIDNVPKPPKVDDKLPEEAEGESKSTPEDNKPEPINKPVDKTPKTVIVRGIEIDDDF